MNKSEIRKMIKQKLMTLSKKEKEKSAKNIADKVIYILQSLNIKNINIYISFQNEVDTKYLINYLYKNKYNICVPVIKNNDIISIKIDEKTKFIKNKYNIFEPVNGHEQKLNDVVITPLVAFSKNLDRLGRGKGFYDRFLQDKKQIKIALAYDLQEYNDLITEPHDIKMDYIITETQIIKKE